MLTNTTQAIVVGKTGGSIRTVKKKPWHRKVNVLSRIRGLKFTNEREICQPITVGDTGY